jgi:hypothetical protein
MLIKVQVAYRHGLVKDFLADGDMLMAEFCRRVKSRGEVRSMRGFKDAGEQDIFTHSFLADEGKEILK